MLDSFRKYTGLMFVVLILLFVGLVFFGSSRESLVSGPTVAQAHGEAFSQQELNKIAISPARLLRELAGNPWQNSVAFGMIEPYLRRMGVVAYAGYELSNDQIMKYLVNRISLQKGMKQFGVHTEVTMIGEQCGDSSRDGANSKLDG